MSPVEVFAPGKLFVIGEYAVLHGARALVVALDAGIVARVERAPRWSLAAADLGVEGALEEVGRDPRAALLASAVEAGRRELALREPLAVAVRGSKPESRAKYGLGGSAASVVAILGALAAVAGADLAARPTRDRLFATALRVHREHQRGRGSGADVAASVHGGWLDYALAEGGPRIASAALPDGLRLAAAWSGVASDTPRAIDAFEAARLARLRGILDRFWAVAAAADRAALLEAVDAYGATLEAMGGDGPGAKRIAALVAAARAAGLAAKGSGAVGGDCAIALGFAPQELARLGESWRAIGARPLDVAVDALGVRVVGARGEAPHA
jgi:mevalonate kinase